ncbi:MAG: hypothetical protein ABSB63_04685 [Spirochaetia bacterium]
MKKAVLVLLLLCVPLLTVSAWRIMYAEQYYKLYHEHLYHYPDDTMEDIYYLESALKADFANPLYALAPIKDTTEWERYRDLFSMHVSLKLIYSFLTLGSKYDKMTAFFYNYPWKRQNLESLDKAEQAYKAAYGWWQKAKEWSAKAWAMRGTHLDHIEEWETENFRVETGDLDYQAIIDAQLARLAKVRADFQKMDKSTY